MESNCPDKGDFVQKDATVPCELPVEVQRVAPAAPPAISAPATSTSCFTKVQLRPDRQGYGNADLIPGGSLEGSSGVLMTERNFPRPSMAMQEDPSCMPGGSSGGGGRRLGFGDSADSYARFDPMFPGQLPPGSGRSGPSGRSGWGRGVFGSAPRIPGEPDDDNFFPPGGRLGEPFGGPGGGQFGPRQGGFGGWDIQGGGGPSWA